jgi:hypothetical protein
VFLPSILQGPRVSRHVVLVACEPERGIFKNGAGAGTSIGATPHGRSAYPVEPTRAIKKIPARLDKDSWITACTVVFFYVIEK